MKYRFLVVGLMFLISCKNEIHLPSYSGSAFSHLDSLMSLQIHELIPKEEIKELEDGWHFHGWDSHPGKEAMIPDFITKESIKLPHRIPDANTNIWYSNKLNVGDGYMRILADDGAQLWVNGKQVYQNTDLLFPINENPKDLTEIIIRVINNAASGGLRKVHWIEKSKWESAKNERARLFEKMVKSAKEDLWTGNTTPSTWEEFPIWFSEPIIIPINRDSLMVRWSGEKNREVKLHFGNDPKMTHKKTMSWEEDGIYSAKIIRQKSNYFYFEMDQTISPIYKITHKTNSGSSTFSVWADSQGGWDIFGKLILQMSIHQPEFTVGIGDLVGNGGSLWQYIKLQNVLHNLPVPHYLFAGNHDYDGSYNEWIPENFTKSLKSKTQKNYKVWLNGPYAFMGLDPNETFPVEINQNSEQFQWFHREINKESWKNAPWKIVFVHQPPFSQGWKGYQGEKSIQNLLQPYWETGQIDLVISGHTHDYERLILNHQKGKTAFLIVGGAGGNLEPIDQMETFPKMDTVIRTHHFGLIESTSKKLKFSAIDLNGNTIDSFELKK